MPQSKKKKRFRQMVWRQKITPLSNKKNDENSQYKEYRDRQQRYRETRKRNKADGKETENHTIE